MVERITKRLRDSRSPLFELLPIRRISSAIPFGYTVRPHGAPFVVVAFQPRLRQVVESAVLRNVRRREMAVIIDYRQSVGVCVVQTPCGLTGQQEIFMDIRASQFGNLSS